MQFAFPLRYLHWWVAATLAALVLVVLALRFLERRRRGQLARFVAADLAPRLLIGYDGRVRRPLYWLTVAGFAALAIAFAQPHWGQAWQEMFRRSRDILVVLDTSESMRAANPLPSRLDRAKQKILMLLDRNPGDRFGLVAFAGAADLQCPLTLDHGYFRAVLNAIDTDVISKKGTDIAAALDTAVEVFREDEKITGYNDPNTRAILLISDGEQVSGDAVKAAEEAGRYASIVAMGIGDPQGTEVSMPDWMGRYRKVMDGEKPHISRLDEETLQKIAAMGNGIYTRAVPDTWDLDEIQKRLDALSSIASQSDLRFRYVNRYQWPLALALLCFAGEGVWLAALPWVRYWRMRREAPEAGRA